jgi:CheY-like chemotaxis protein
MSEDLLSLRMLMVGAPKSDCALWSQGAMRASVPIEFFSADAEGAGMPQGGLDIVVVDSSLSEMANAAVVQAARALRPAPLVVACGANGLARPAGVDGLLPRPSGVEEARRLADLCVKACLPNRVLIVDDSSTMRSIVRKILSGSRFRLEIDDSADGESALAQVRSGRFGLVFVDYNMPGFSGLDTLKEIRRQHEEVAVVLMTSSLDAAVAERARGAGAFAFLKKPFYPADIDGILERYFGLTG